jgi:hypothetical protein
MMITLPKPVGDSYKFNTELPTTGLGSIKCLFGLTKSSFGDHRFSQNGEPRFVVEIIGKIVKRPVCHVGTLLAFLRGIMSGSCVTPAADCGVRRALSRRIKLFHFGDQPRDGSRDIDRLLLIRQCGPCAGATGCGVHYPGFTERPAERLCLCNVDSRVSQLKYLQLCMRKLLEC